MTNRSFDEIWNLPRETALSLILAHAAEIEFLLLDEDALDRELGELDYLIHTTRDRIFFDARERNRTPRKPVRRTLDDLLDI